MRAIVMTGYGKPEVVQFRDMSKPKVSDHEVLVEVYSVGMNPIDIKLPKKEMWPLLTFKMPLIMGTDFAGKVIATGSNVTNFKTGDEVYGSFSTSKMGAFAEQVAIHENELSLKPKNLSFDEAASIPLVGLTVYQALKETANLQPSQKVFVQAGSGGIGTFAIQFAKALGAEVATTTSAKNTSWVKGLGANRVIDYNNEKFYEILKDYDVVLNSVDGEPIKPGFSILKPGGHFLSVVGPPDLKFAKSLGLNFILQMVMALLGSKAAKLAKEASVNYTFVFVKPSGAQLNEIKKLIEQEKIKPVIDRVFAFNDFRDAFAYVAQGRTKGKVVIKIKGE